MDRSKNDLLDSCWRVLQLDSWDEKIPDPLEPKQELENIPPVHDGLPPVHCGLPPVHDGLHSIYDGLPPIHYGTPSEVSSDSPGRKDATPADYQEILDKISQIQHEIASLRLFVREVLSDTPGDKGQKPDAKKAGRLFR